MSSRYSRTRAAALLALFCLALLLGVFGHPFADAHRHACHGDHAHVESAPAHDHDARHCALCHLFGDIAQVQLTAGPTLPPQAAPTSVVASAAPAPRAFRAPRVLGPRGPPSG